MQALDSLLYVSTVFNVYTRDSVCSLNRGVRRWLQTSPSSHTGTIMANNQNQSHTGYGAERITPSDTGFLRDVRGFNVATAGTVYVDTADGDTNVPVYVAAGVIFALAVTRIYATGTTAADITVIR